MSNRDSRRAAATTPALHGASNPALDLVLFLALAPETDAPRAESPDAALWSLVHRLVSDRHHHLVVARASHGPPSLTFDREPPTGYDSTAATRPQHFHLEVQPLPGPTSPTSSNRGSVAPPQKLALVVQVDSQAAGVADTVAATLTGVGFPCCHALSIEAAAQELVDRLFAAPPPFHDPEASVPASAPSIVPHHSPWRPVLLVPLLGLLVIHSLNPWLRSVAMLRFQLPGFSYDFVTPETVPLVAPIVVGIPTVVALAVFTWLQRSTNVDPPRWARWAMLIPVATTVFFAARFFIEGRIISSFSQIEHSRGFGMLWETVGMMEPMLNDNFRYLRPAFFNYSHTIHPIWEPWSILLLAVGAAVLGARFAWPRRAHPNGPGTLSSLT